MRGRIYRSIAIVGRHPITRTIASVAALALLLAFGVVMLAVLLGVGLVVAIATMLRWRWLSRRSSPTRSPFEEARPIDKERVLEGEYTVIRRDSSEDS